MCLTAVDQSAPEALEESRRVEELARRLGDREILLRNYMVLVPWWQASAEYQTDQPDPGTRRGTRRRLWATRGRCS